MRASLLLAAVFATIFAPGCTLDAPGLTPLPQTFYFPSAMSLSPSLPGEGPRFLYVANSNFDLRYDGATVIELDAAMLADVVRTRQGVTTCGAVECIPMIPPGVWVNEVRAGSYVSGLGVSADGTRVYMSVRAEGNLTWIEIDPATGGMSCWGDGDPVGTCDDAHRVGNTDIAETRGETLPADPVRLRVVPYSDLDPTQAGDAILVASRNGSLSLFIDGPSRGVSDPPQLTSVITGLPTFVAGIGFDPTTRLAYVTSASDPSGGTAPNRTMSRAGIALDPMPQRTYLYSAPPQTLTGIADGTDVRDVVFDARPGTHREYVLTRAPQAILLADLSIPPVVAGSLPVDQIVPIDAGPSRLEFAQVGGRSLLFASCYDARTVYVVDADSGELVTVIRGLGGPFELAIDATREMLYVTDFRSSTLRAVDLAPLAMGITELTAIAIGTPHAPPGST